MKQKDIQVRKIINNYTSSKDKKIYLVYGYQGTNKNRFIQNLLEFNEKKVSIPSWNRSEFLDEENLLSDIKNNIFENLNENNYNYDDKNMTRNINKAKKELNEICSLITDKDKTTKTKLLWPILNTISSFGISLGVPLLSLSFFRTDQIIESIGAWFFYFIVTICTLLIVFALTSTVTYLITVVKTNRFEIRKQQPKVLLETFIKKWFGNKKDSKKSIFKISTNFDYIYTNSQTRYIPEQYIKYLDILNKLNNNLFVPLDIENSYDVKNLVTKFKSNQYLLVNSEQEKLKSYESDMLEYIKNTINQIYGSKIDSVFRRSYLFQNALRKFVEKSSNNYQIIKLFNYVRIFSDVCNANEKDKYSTQSYFVHLLVLCIYRILDVKSFTETERSLSEAMILTEEIKNDVTFNLLKIELLVAKNLNIFKQNSFIFKIGEIIYDKELLNTTLISINSNKKEPIYDLSNIPSNNLLEPIKSKIKDNNIKMFTNQNEEIISVYTIESINDDLFKAIEEVNVFNSKNSVDISVVYLVEFNKVIVFEKIINDYIISTSILKI